MNVISSWKGQVFIDGVQYNSVSEIPTALELNDNMIIILNTKENNSASRDLTQALYRIEVKQYMTKQSTEDFDFMQKWNNDIPMPMRTMVGTIVKETPGMVYMNLHADILEDRMCVCMKCGKPIRNEVSQYFGMGPECGGHNYINPFESKEALAEAVSNYRKDLQNITWSGWIIKSAITRMEEYNE